MILLAWIGTVWLLLGAVEQACRIADTAIDAIRRHHQPHLSLRITREGWS